MQLPATLRDGISLGERTGRKRACGVHFPLAMSLKGTPILGLQIVILLAIVGGRVVGQNSGDDTMCLTGFKASLQDNGGALAQWTPVQLASPCNTSAAPLNGIVCQNDRINSINLKGTNLMGSISPSLANCSNLQTLDLSANQLSGPIPTNLGNLSYLTTLNFSKNQLTGFIPLELSACIYLNVIDLHQNQLTGAIPAQLGYLSRLKAFDVSDNQLSGPVPTTLSNTSNGSPRFNSTSFLGNKRLYGYPLPPLKTHNLSVLAILGIGLGSGLVSLVVSFTAVCIWLRVTEQGYAAEEGKISQLMSES